VPIKDSESTDAYEKFEQVIGFFKRVKEKRGKIYVHCTAGASRAPTMVIAFLIVVLNVKLVDAYNYIMARRPLVMINDHFLAQLAKLEYEQGWGTSVFWNDEWRIYEYNMMRSDLVDKCKADGIFKTVMRIYDRSSYDDDD
jgi:protein-tyrosine phosphatase